MLVMEVLWWERWVNPWDSLGSQSNLLDELRASGWPYLKKKYGWNMRNDTQGCPLVSPTDTLTPLLHTCLTLTHKYTIRCTLIHTHIHTQTDWKQTSYLSIQTILGEKNPPREKSQATRAGQGQVRSLVENSPATTLLKMLSLISNQGGRCVVRQSSFHPLGPGQGLLPRC